MQLQWFQFLGTAGFLLNQLSPSLHACWIGYEGRLINIPEKVPQQHSAEDLQHESLLFSWLTTSSDMYACARRLRRVGLKELLCHLPACLLGPKNYAMCCQRLLAR